MQDNLHKGHRDRLKARYRSQGLSSFEPHNILELLLFYAIPQRDTNGIAHELLNTFGSLSGVFDAPVEELVKIKGITENSATLIKLIPDICGIYFAEKARAQFYEGDNLTEKLGNELIARYIGETNEVMYLICLDNRLHVLCVDKLGEGINDAVQITTRKIVETAIRTNATNVIISHNHPTGAALPSKEDKETTAYLKRTLESISVRLLDHIIVAKDDYFSMAASGMMDCLALKSAPRSSFLDELSEEYRTNDSEDIADEILKKLEEAEI